MLPFVSKYSDKFVNPKAIFVMDLVLSTIASTIVLLVLTFFANSQSYYSSKFALWWIGGAVVVTVVVTLFLKGYKLVIRHTSSHDLAIYSVTALLKVVLLGVVIAVSCLINRSVLLALIGDFLLTLFLIIFVRMLMKSVYEITKGKMNELKNRQRVLVFGTSDKAVSTITRLQNSTHYQVVGFLTTDPEEKQYKLSDFPIFYFASEEELQEIIDKLSVSAILFSHEKDVQREKSLVDYCSHNHIRLLVSPTIDEVGDVVVNNRVREVRIEDLLGRPEIELEIDPLKDYFKDKVVMVTGGAGSIGSELVRQLASFGVKQLVVFDNAETPMHNLQMSLEKRYPGFEFVFVIGDVRQKPRLDYAFRNYKPQVVFHAAAYKHVPLMEENPCEAVLVNVYGSRNVADKCVEYGVEMMVMISTDKAVNPTNIMGCTKRLAEIYVQSLGLAIEQGKHEGHTKFVTTRFGNVLGSNGSVIPFFKQQIESGGPVTVTHPEITRFFMSIPEACRLVMEAATLGSGNQIFAFDMGESVKIDTLARRMIELAGLEVGKDIEIEYTGLRPGEKLYEEVLSNKENTLPTQNDRIHIAKVREYEYDNVVEVVSRLERLSFEVKIPEMVMLMKETVPEFISKNSRFEIYDKH